MERWTDEKLDKLAATLTHTVTQLAAQMQQLHQQIGQLSQQVQQTCSSVDGLTTALKAPSLPLETPYLEDSASLSSLLDVDWPTRLATVEQQMQQLSQQVQQLERCIATNYTTNYNLANLSLAAAASLPNPFSDDEVEDEPDEVLWDFIEPNSNS